MGSLEQLTEFVRSHARADGAVVVVVNPHGSGQIVIQPSLQGTNALQLADELEAFARVLRGH